ncbi:hypothetical protein C8R43DRAFT_1107666 [Mycena crocata]|nr:hypothetical protein C8R43DRAFT_1107666 [Mycena crocata]
MNFFAFGTAFCAQILSPTRFCLSKSSFLLLISRQDYKYLQGIGSIRLIGRVKIWLRQLVSAKARRGTFHQNPLAQVQVGGLRVFREVIGTKYCNRYHSIFHFFTYHINYESFVNPATHRKYSANQSDHADKWAQFQLLAIFSIPQGILVIVVALLNSLAHSTMTKIFVQVQGNQQPFLGPPGGSLETNALPSVPPPSQHSSPNFPLQNGPIRCPALPQTSLKSDYTIYCVPASSIKIQLFFGEKSCQQAHPTFECNAPVLPLGPDRNFFTLRESLQAGTPHHHVGFSAAVGSPTPSAPPSSACDEKTRYRLPASGQNIPHTHAKARHQNLIFGRPANSIAAATSSVLIFPNFRLWPAHIFLFPQAAWKARLKTFKFSSPPAHFSSRRISATPHQEPISATFALQNFKNFPRGGHRDADTQGVRGREMAISGL